MVNPLRMHERQVFEYFNNKSRVSAFAQPKENFGVDDIFPCSDSLEDMHCASLTSQDVVKHHEKYKKLSVLMLF